MSMWHYQHHLKYRVITSLMYRVIHSSDVFLWKALRSPFFQRSPSIGITAWSCMRAFELQCHKRHFILCLTAIRNSFVPMSNSLLVGLKFTTLFHQQQMGASKNNNSGTIPTVSSEESRFHIPKDMAPSNNVEMTDKWFAAYGVALEQQSLPEEF